MNSGIIDLLVTNVNLASMAGSEPYGLIQNGALAVSNGKISWTGPESECSFEPKEILDAKGCLAAPGLIDCHTHLIYGGNRAKEFELRLQGATYEEIARAGGGIISTVKAARELSMDDMVEQSRPRIEALMAEGVTTLEIKSGYGLDLDTEIRMLEAARRLGREYPVDVKTTFLGAHALPPEYKDKSDDYIDFVCNVVLPEAASKGLVDAVDAFCETIGFTLDQTEKVFQAAEKHGLPVKLHAEQLSDQEGAILAAKYKALSADHLEYISEKGVKAMAEAGTVAVLLPGAFYFLRETQLPPVDLFRKHGAHMAVSTDCNPGSSPVTSILLTLNMACTLFRLTPEEAIKGTTINAARALGVQETAGSLEPGKDADFVLWNVHEPAELAYNIGFNPLAAVYKRGVKIR